ncbi:MarR family transcriptional regulator [Marinomonas sp. 5E14-1]|uniref:MarR family winged helix-turn-helix transcriptional regulator n=1 Tax=Marinomonas sp. 5E14-1 TaxID=3153922 RepID=UPI0032640411
MMNKPTQQILDDLPSIGGGYTPGTSLVTHISYKLSSLLLLELESLIKNNSSLNLASWRALRGLSTIESSSQKELVQFANVDQGQMSRALTDLEKKGFVISQRSKEDKRSWRFSITEEGQLYHTQLSPIVDSFHQELTNSLTASELETYVQLSAKVAAIVVNKRPENS